MPSLADLYAKLYLLGYPIAYHHFNTAVPSVPYIVYYATGYNTEFANNENYVNITPVTIELYTDTKNLTAESAVEATLVALELTYTKDEAWIEEEQLYEIIYETEVLQ